jgi:hypothetical protein
MSFQQNGVDISLVAAADLSSSQFLAVKVDSAGKAALAGAGEFAIGVLQNKPTAGQAATVRISGVTKMVAAGTFNPGVFVTADAASKATTATAGRTNTSDAGAAADPLIGSNVLGVALETAAANNVIAVALTQSGAIPTTVQ